MSEETVVKPDISETITSVFIVQLCSSLLPLFSSLSIATMNLLLEISAQIETSSSANISLKIFREILHLGLGENCSVRNNGVSPPPPPPPSQTHTHTHTLLVEPNLTTFLALLRAHIKSSTSHVVFQLYCMYNMYSIQSAIYTAIYIGDGSVLYDITDYLENNQHILEIKDTQDSKLTLSLSLFLQPYHTHTHTQYTFSQ